MYSSRGESYLRKVSMAFVLDTDECIRDINGKIYALDLTVLEADACSQAVLRVPVLLGKEMSVSIFSIEPIFEDAIRAAVICQCDELTLAGSAIYFQRDMLKESVQHRYSPEELQNVNSWNLAEACNHTDSLRAYSFRHIWKYPIEINGDTAKPKFIQIRNVMYLSRTIATTLAEISLCTQWASSQYDSTCKSYRILAQEYYESCPKRKGPKGGTRVFGEKLLVKASENGYRIRDYEFRQESS